MGCEPKNQKPCNPKVARNITINNKTIGRDGEDAYDAYVRAGGTLTKDEWALSPNSNIYSKYDW